MNPAKPFQLTAVLNHRKRRKENAVSRLNKAEHNRDNTLRKLEEKQKELINKSGEMEDKQRQGVTIQQLLLYRTHLQYLQSECSKISKNLEHRNRIVEQERTHVTRCAQEHKVLAQLADKQNSQWRAHLNKKEAEFIDELAVIRHNKTTL